LTFRPSAEFQNDAIVTYQKYHTHGSSDFIVEARPSDLGGLIGTLYPNLTALLAQQQALGARTHIPVGVDLSRAGGDLLDFQNITRVSLAENLTFRNIIGLQSAHTNQAADVDGTADAIFDETLYRYPTREGTEEAQLQGHNFGGKLDWQAGVFYLNQRAKADLQDVTFLGTEVFGRNADESESRAIYAQGTYDLSAIINRLKFTLGARKTWDKLNNFSLGPDPANPAPSFCGEPSQNCSFQNNNWTTSNALTYTIGFDYQVTADTLVYLQSRRGYRPGGATRTTIQNGEVLTYPFGPEYVTDYELGVKSDWAIGDVPIRTNVDVYDQQYTDIQVAATRPEPRAAARLVNVTTNAAAARLWGAEFEATARLTEHLHAGLNFDYLHFEYTKFGSGVNAASLIGGQTANRVPRKYGVILRYDVPLQGRAGDLSFKANWGWQDQVGNFGGDRQIPAYGLLNSSLDWNRVGGSPVDLSLFVSNALNKTYESGGIGLPIGFDEATYGDPRMYGLRLNYHFGAQ
jgi:iron complex outermembrane receptor protein